MTGLTVDRLDGPAVQVLRMAGARFGGEAAREPHRHDYHELIWVRAGAGRHLLDGRPFPVRPNTVTIIGRGQVHVFEHGEDLHGAVVRFRDEALAGAEGASRGTPAWLLAGRGGRTVGVPEGEAGRLDALVDALHAEARRPPDGHGAEVERHLLSAMLAWLERWYDASRTERREADDPEVQLHRRFTRLLERDFARHHDAGHYADALGVPPAALARGLGQVTGRPTKDLITDRVMLEAARLLRFTDLTVGEIAHATGFEDPLYFSRAFKRRHAEAPMAYRERARGGGEGPAAAGAPALRHLALAVRDEASSRAFYERWFGFGARPPRRYPDGVLMLYGPGDVALALGPADGPPALPAFLHFGFVAADAAAVRALADALAAAGVEIVERWDEPAYASVKCRDPDGYVVEAYWEPA